MTPKILILEDEAYLRNLFIKAFRTVSYDVTAVADGQAILTYLHENLPDVLVMDIGTAIQDGLRILKQIRQYERQLSGSKQVNIIVMSGNSQAERAPEAKLADFFMTKPVSIRDLVILSSRLEAGV